MSDGTSAAVEDLPLAAALEEKLAAVPPSPGVYLLKERGGTVIYVGKAKSLRARVWSYFRGGDGRSQVRFLVQRVRDIECLVTRNEKEALLLEDSLIKQFKPRYNIRLKDDKSYVSVKITKHDWPRVVVTRRIVKDGGRYFGPFHSAAAVRDTLDIIRKVFPLRTCSDVVFRNRSRPCLEYQIKRCLGPCVLPVDRADYGEHLRAVELLLEGRDSSLRKMLEERMRRASRSGCSCADVQTRSYWRATRTRCFCSSRSVTRPIDSPSAITRSCAIGGVSHLLSTWSPEWAPPAGGSCCGTSGAWRVCVPPRRWRSPLLPGSGRRSRPRFTGFLAVRRAKLATEPARGRPR